MTRRRKDQLEQQVGGCIECHCPPPGTTLFGKLARARVSEYRKRQLERGFAGVLVLVILLTLLVLMFLRGA